MLELIVDNVYKKSSATGDSAMTDLSMSHFATKEDFLRAKADLAKQQAETVTVKAAPNKVEVTRLIAGVELKLVQSGFRWHLGVKKK